MRWTGWWSTPSVAGEASGRPIGTPGRAHRLGRVVAGLALAVVALALAGAEYQSIATARDRRAYPPLAGWSTWAATGCTSTASGTARRP
jgi:hypothetical protein